MLCKRGINKIFKFANISHSPCTFLELANINVIRKSLSCSYQLVHSCELQTLGNGLPFCYWFSRYCLLESFLKAIPRISCCDKIKISRWSELFTEFKTFFFCKTCRTLTNTSVRRVNSKKIGFSTCVIDTPWADWLSFYTSGF